jgi:hypothetical protein
MGRVGPISLRDIVSLREQVTILYGYNWSYQDLFQSVTGFPHHWSTSQAYSPLLIHITSETDCIKSGTSRWLPVPNRKKAEKSACVCHPNSLASTKQSFF